MILLNSSGQMTMMSPQNFTLARDIYYALQPNEAFAQNSFGNDLYRRTGRLLGAPNTVHYR
jgi:hypothetical protein